MVALLPVWYPMQITSTRIVNLLNTLFIAPSTHLLEVTEKTFLRIKENVQIGIHPKNISRDNGKNCMEGNFMPVM